VELGTARAATASPAAASATLSALAAGRPDTPQPVTVLHGDGPAPLALVIREHVVGQSHARESPHVLRAHVVRHPPSLSARGTL